MKYLDDSIYIDQVLNGDTAAYAHLVNKHKDFVFTIVFRIIRHREDAEEVAQDVFVKVYQKLRSFQKASRFTTWLYRIAYNEAISKIRKPRMDTTVLEGDHIENLVDEKLQEEILGLDEEEQKMFIQKAINSLNEQESTILTLFYFEETPVGEISEITGFSQSNVKVKLHRIRKKLFFEFKNTLEHNIQSFNH